MIAAGKWEQPEKEYRQIPAKKRKLGYVQYIPVGDNTFIVNMIGQHDIKTNEFGVPPVRYGAIKTCLQKTAEFAQSLNNGANTVSIHMPRIGCGLAGGDWSIMEKVIEEAVGDVEVVVYDFQLEAPKQSIGVTTSHGVIAKEDRTPDLAEMLRKMAQE